MICKKCGTNFSEGIFCPECGTKVDESKKTNNVINQNRINVLANVNNISDNKKNKKKKKSIVIGCIVGFVVLVILSSLFSDNSNEESIIQVDNNVNIEEAGTNVVQQEIVDVEKVSEQSFSSQEINTSEVEIETQKEDLLVEENEQIVVDSYNGFELYDDVPEPIMEFMYNREAYVDTYYTYYLIDYSLYVYLLSDSEDDSIYYLMICNMEGELLSKVILYQQGAGSVFYSGDDVEMVIDKNKTGNILLTVHNQEYSYYSGEYSYDWIACDRQYQFVE